MLNISHKKIIHVTSINVNIGSIEKYSLMRKCLLKQIGNSPRKSILLKVPPNRHISPENK